MIPLGPILGVAGIAAATILVPMAVQGYNGMIAEREASRIEVALSRQAMEYEKQITNIRESARSDHEETIAEYVEKEQSDAKRINKLSRTIEIQLDQNPLSVDASIATELFLGLCKTKAGRDIDARKACDISASKADLARYSPAISVTAQRIADWQHLCEETGSADYCNPRLIAFTPTAVIQLIGWINSIDTVRMNVEANRDTIERQLQEILAMPGPTIGD